MLFACVVKYTYDALLVRVTQVQGVPFVKKNRVHLGISHQYRFDHLRFSSMQAPNGDMHFYAFNQALPGCFRCMMFKHAGISLS